MGRLRARDANAHVAIGTMPLRVYPPPLGRLVGPVALVDLLLASNPTSVRQRHLESNQFGRAAFLDT